MDKLPRSIVLPGSLVRSCLGHCYFELFDDETIARRRAWLNAGHRYPAVSMRDLTTIERCARGVLRRPWPSRGVWMANRCPPTLLYWMMGNLAAVWNSIDRNRDYRIYSRFAPTLRRAFDGVPPTAARDQVTSRHTRDPDLLTLKGRFAWGRLGGCVDLCRWAGYWFFDSHSSQGSG